jgi:hypothetical protein
MLARDRRLASVHEAGHFVMARRVGMLCLNAKTCEHQPKDLTEKNWVGSIQCVTAGVTMKTRRLVAVAGAVAEACWRGETFDNFQCDWELGPEIMSQADWEMSGCCPGEVSVQLWKAVKQALNCSKETKANSGWILCSNHDG